MRAISARSSYSGFARCGPTFNAHFVTGHADAPLASWQDVALGFDPADAKSPRLGHEHSRDGGVIGRLTQGRDDLRGPVLLSSHRGDPGIDRARRKQPVNELAKHFAGHVVDGRLEHGQGFTV